MRRRTPRVYRPQHDSRRILLAARLRQRPQHPVQVQGGRGHLGLAEQAVHLPPVVGLVVEQVDQEHLRRVVAGFALVVDVADRSGQKFRR